MDLRGIHVGYGRGPFRDEDINGALCITPSPNPFQVVRQATHILP